MIEVTNDKSQTPALEHKNPNTRLSRGRSETADSCNDLLLRRIMISRWPMIALQQYKATPERPGKICIWQVKPGWKACLWLFFPESLVFFSNLSFMCSVIGTCAGNCTNRVSYVSWPFFVKKQDITISAVLREIWVSWIHNAIESIVLLLATIALLMKFRLFSVLSILFPLSSMSLCFGIWILGHHILELRPQCFDRTELIPNLLPSAHSPTWQKWDIQQ